ncbi:MAG: hypothetical protein IKW60_01200 [Clostridia bacterium]|nr:hypothetical protein [Clostridia bacterium]
MFHANGNKEKVAKENPEIARRNAEIEEERKAFAEKNPNFDMAKEMENSQFVNYVWGNGISVEDAYLLCHKEELLKTAPKEETQTQQNKQERVLENGAGKSRPAIARKNPKDLSDKEIDAIIERVKKGETITF